MVCQHVQLLPVLQPLCSCQIEAAIVHPWLTQPGKTLRHTGTPSISASEAAHMANMAKDMSVCMCMQVVPKRSRRGVLTSGGHMALKGLLPGLLL